MAEPRDTDELLTLLAFDEAWRRAAAALAKQGVEGIHRDWLDELPARDKQLLAHYEAVRHAAAAFVGEGLKKALS